MPGMQGMEYFCGGNGFFQKIVPQGVLKLLQKKTEPVVLKDISLSADERQSCGIGELGQGAGRRNRPRLPCFGRWRSWNWQVYIVVAGVQKSYLHRGLSVLYISGEESLQTDQAPGRSGCGTFNDKLKLLCETNLENIREIIERTKPDVASRGFYSDDVS